MDGVSFKCPERFSLAYDATPGEDFFLKLYPPSKNYYLNITVERTHENAKEAVNDILCCDDLFEPSYLEVKPMSLNGISGYYFTDLCFGSYGELYLQFYADIPGVDPELKCPRVLSLSLVVVNKNLTVDDVLSSPDFILFSEGLKFED